MNEDPTATRPGPPPLRIHHFLAWMAVTAVIFSLWRASMPSNAFDNLTATYMARIAVGPVILAAGVTAAGFAVYWQWQGFAAIVQPGQWLLLSFLLELPNQIFQRFYLVIWQGNEQAWRRNIFIWDLADFGWTASYVIVFGLLQIGAPLAVFGWGAWRIADTRWWRIFFVVMALGYVLAVAAFFFQAPFREIMQQWTRNVTMIITSVVPSAIVVVLITCAVVGDIIAGRRRFWTHWLGAGLVAAGRIMGLVSSFLWFIR